MRSVRLFLRAWRPPGSAPIHERLGDSGLGQRRGEQAELRILLVGFGVPSLHRLIDRDDVAFAGRADIIGHGQSPGRGKPAPAMRFSAQFERLGAGATDRRNRRNVEPIIIIPTPILWSFRSLVHAGPRSGPSSNCELSNETNVVQVVQGKTLSYA